MARKPQQLSIPSLRDFTRTEHGGALRKGRRKLARPVATKRPMHVVLRSSRARGHWSMLTPDNNGRVLAIVYGAESRFGVKILRFANVGNHLHIVLKARTREAFQRFLKTIAGLIARMITGAKKGAALRERRSASEQRSEGEPPSNAGAFWDALAFSRVLHWGRDLETAKDYVFQNALEAFGVATKRKAGSTIPWLGDG